MALHKINQGCHYKLSFVTILFLKADEEHQAILWFKVDLGKLKESYENKKKNTVWDLLSNYKPVTFLCCFLEKNAKTFFSLQLNKHEFPTFACHKSGYRNLLWCITDYSEKNNSSQKSSVKPTSVFRSTVCWFK